MPPSSAGVSSQPGAEEGTSRREVSGCEVRHSDRGRYPCTLCPTISERDPIENWEVGTPSYFGVENEEKDEDEEEEEEEPAPPFLALDVPTAPRKTLDLALAVTINLARSRRS